LNGTINADIEEEYKFIGLFNFREMLDSL